jgi:hypothetical protein
VRDICFAAAIGRGVDECVIVAETHRHSRSVLVGMIATCLWRQLFGLVAIVGWLSSKVLVVAQDNCREDKTIDCCIKCR